MDTSSSRTRGGVFGGFLFESAERLQEVMEGGTSMSGEVVFKILNLPQVQAVPI